MRFSPRVKKLILIAWACALVFGLSFQVTEAEALHFSCQDICENNCASGCKGTASNGCTCIYRCVGGGGGTAICTL